MIFLVICLSRVMKSAVRMYNLDLQPQTLTLCHMVRIGTVRAQQLIKRRGVLSAGISRAVQLFRGSTAPECSFAFDHDSRSYIWATRANDKY